MKILYVITKANLGGAQKYVYELAVAATAAGHEVVVAYGLPAQGGEPGALVEKLDVAGIRCIALPALTRDIGLLREWHAFWLLRNLLRSERPEVVHLNSSKAGALGALAARLAGTRRIIFTVHGWPFNEARPFWQRVIFKWLMWVTITSTDTAICVSKAVRRDVAWMPFIKKRLVVIYNGVAEPTYKTREEARRALWPKNENGMWIGMLSELHPTKRVEDAIEAMQEVPEAKLVVLGEGEERHRLEALIKARGLGERVHLVGFVADGARYLPAFDLFLHASQSEALAYAVIEAGLAGLPVVATGVGGIPEIVEGGVTGLLVPPRSPAALAAALHTLIEDPARAKELGAALHATCRMRFDPARMIRETLALYTR